MASQGEHIFWSFNFLFLFLSVFVLSEEEEEDNFHLLFDGGVLMQYKTVGDKNMGGFPKTSCS